MIIFTEEHLENIWRVCHGLAEKAYGYRLEVSKGHEYYNLTARYLNLIGEVHQVRGAQRDILDNDPTVPALLDFRMSRGYQVLSVNAPAAQLLYREPDHLQGMSFRDLLTEPSLKTWNDLKTGFLGGTPIEFATALQFKVNRGLSYNSFCYVSHLADGTVRVSSSERDRTGKSHGLMRAFGIPPRPGFVRSGFPFLESGYRQEREREFMDRIIRYLDDRDTLAIPNIRAMSHDLSINEKKLNKLFKKTVGLTPYAFYKERRLERAMELLVDGTKEIDEIRTALGYSSRSGFYRAFKDRFGLNPGEVKRAERPPES
ncbi:helix-turn-helix domain-containing protein [Sinomicrobium oceani]|uniref:helix-turn-helix domain-containing protein n=1 Tax=Sinomicrobium oceani TaxID=1150368 RepID=UPI00227C4EBC|nr:helix-turn-helix domain-containing protein [Sinomicrobium oceani]